VSQNPRRHHFGHCSNLGAKLAVDFGAGIPQGAGVSFWLLWNRSKVDHANITQSQNRTTTIQKAQPVRHGSLIRIVTPA
jgi:hypothetical protein